MGILVKAKVGFWFLSFISSKGNFMHQWLLSSIFASSEDNEDVILYAWLWKRGSICFC